MRTKGTSTSRLGSEPSSAMDDPQKNTAHLKNHCIALGAVPHNRAVNYMGLRGVVEIEIVANDIQNAWICLDGHNFYGL